MGKGGHTSTISPSGNNNNCCNSMNHIYINNSLLPDFFSFGKDKSEHNHHNKQSLKIIKNNNKKQKKQEKKLNQFEYLNVFNYNLNNISFTSCESNNDSTDNSSNNNNNDDNNSNNNDSVKLQPENKEELLENNNNNNNNNNNTLITDSINNNNNNNIDNSTPVFEEYNDNLNNNCNGSVNNNIEIYEEEEEEELIDSNFGELLVIGENYEFEIMNKKLNIIKRSSSHNKKLKLNRMYKKVYEINKEVRKAEWLAVHYSRAKDKTPKHIKQHQYSYKPVFGNNDSYETQLRKALALSVSEYDRQLRNTSTNSQRSMALSQSQINDILNRDLTAEDYELLLLLDSTVKPKTVDIRDINNLPLVTFNSDLAEKYPSCMVCLTSFEENETLTKLDCGHIFHTNCISNWLSVASTKCPIDNISILDD